MEHGTWEASGSGLVLAGLLSGSVVPEPQPAAPSAVALAVLVPFFALPSSLPESDRVQREWCGLDGYRGSEPARPKGVRSCEWLLVVQLLLEVLS